MVQQVAKCFSFGWFIINFGISASAGSKQDLSMHTLPAAKQEIIDFLQWYIEVGCDDLIDEQPLNRFALSAERAVRAEPVAYEAAETNQPNAHPSVDIPAPVRAQAPHKTQAHAPQEGRARAPQQTMAQPQVFAQSIPPLAAPNLAEIASLSDLRDALSNFDGSSLKKMAKNMVFSDGNPESRVMLIGEAPGREEDQQAKPFIGPSGQLLDKMLAHIGLDRSTVYIANLIPWRPPGDRTPSSDEVALFLPFLMRHIELVSPDIIVAVGGTAAKALLNSPTGITKLRGQWSSLPCAGRDIPILPMFHPAFLLRTPARKAEAWADLCALRAKLASQVTA